MKRLMMTAALALPIVATAALAQTDPQTPTPTPTPGVAGGAGPTYGGSGNATPPARPEEPSRTPTDGTLGQAPPPAPSGQSQQPLPGQKPQGQSAPRGTTLGPQPR
jgi:hypothetical protein